MTDILAGNTDPQQNPFWGKFAAHRRERHAPAGGAQDRYQQRRQGPHRVRLHRAARPGRPRQPASTRWWSAPGPATRTAAPSRRRITRSSRSTSRRPMWQGFMDEATKTWPIQDFARPGGLVNADVDAWSGGKPTQFTTKTFKEIFIDGTVPGDDPIHVGSAGRHATRPAPTTCGTTAAPGCPRRRVSSTSRRSSRTNRSGWQPITTGLRRARQGVGVEGGPDPEEKTATSYFYNSIYHPYGKNWGAPFQPELDCGALPSPSPQLCMSPSRRSIRSVRRVGLPVADAIALAVTESVGDARGDVHA